jgi:dienelactone hydrolase
MSTNPGAPRPIDQHDSLDDFERTTFTHNDITRAVYRIGHGPAVLVIHEIPGITPAVANFARRIAANGMTAVCPWMVGEPGKPVSQGYMLQSLAKVCVRKEFNLFATGRTSPVIEWLKPLAHDSHVRYGGPGVGVVGMCFTGGFALAMAVDPVVVAPVLSQPSPPVPLPWTKKRASSGLDCTDAELAAVKARFDDDPDLCVLGYRFSGDPLVPAQRFERLERELGDRFKGVTFDSSPGNPGGHPKDAHSVLSQHLVESAAVEVVEFFRRRLGVDA